MGRPLYSKAFKTTTTPAVRDPDPPVFEKWSYLNAFDPDSDEFFENENAVYEDFIGPVRPANTEEDVEEDDDVEERGMLVVRMGNASPITSESSLSDSDSPLADGAEDPAHLVVDDFHDLSQLEDGETTPTGSAVRVRLATRTVPVDVRWAAEYSRGLRSASPARSHIQRESLPVPPASAPIPVPVVRRPIPVDERTLGLSSTPPRQSAFTHVSMSPPPTSTPRLYSWARNPGHSSSPSAGSPFTNPHARTSYTHLSPALIRIRDVTV